MTRKLKKGGYSTILSVIVIVAVILVNMIVGRLPEKIRRLDISSNQVYTLGDTTKESLAALEKEIIIYVVAPPDQVDERISSFITRYSDLSKQIKIETLDPILHPSQLERLGAESNSLLVLCEDTGKKETILFDQIIKFDEMSYYYSGQYIETEFDGEGLLTSAIARVSNEVEKNIYETQGHGEIPVGEMALDLLGKSGFDLNQVNLLTNGGIPEDSDLLLINAPESDLAVDEKDMIIEYLNQGNHVMLLAGNSEKERPNLEALMEHYGLSLEKGFVADTNSNYRNNPYHIFPTYDMTHEVFNGIDSKMASLVINSAAMSPVEELREGVSVNAFLNTTEGGILVIQEEQISGSYILGAVATENLSEERESRFTVFSTPSLIDDGVNGTFSNLSNLNIFMNAVTLNFEEVENISIPAKSLEIAYNTVSFGGTWGMLFIFVIPALTIAIGLLIFVRRRRL